MGLFAEIKIFDLPIGTAKKILTEYIEKDTGKKVKDVNFTVGVQCTGYGANERDEPCLRGIKVTFE